MWRQSRSEWRRDYTCRLRTGPVRLLIAVVELRALSDGAEQVCSAMTEDEIGAVFKLLGLETEEARERLRRMAETVQPESGTDAHHRVATDNTRSEVNDAKLEPNPE